MPVITVVASDIVEYRNVVSSRKGVRGPRLLMRIYRWTVVEKLDSLKSKLSWEIVCMMLFSSRSDQNGLLFHHCSFGRAIQSRSNNKSTKILLIYRRPYFLHPLAS